MYLMPQSHHVNDKNNTFRRITQALIGAPNLPLLVALDHKATPFMTRFANGHSALATNNANTLMLYTNSLMTDDALLLAQCME